LGSVTVRIAAAATQPTTISQRSFTQIAASSPHPTLDMPRVCPIPAIEARHMLPGSMHPVAAALRDRPAGARIALVVEGGGMRRSVGRDGAGAARARPPIGDVEALG
jgi:hypothetical protein